MFGKCLVVGGEGFVGYYLCQALARSGYEVICVDPVERHDSFVVEPAYHGEQLTLNIYNRRSITHFVTFLKDFLNSVDVSKMDIQYVFMLADIVGVRRYDELKDRGWSYHLDLIRDYARLINATPDAIHTFFSSSEVYGDTQGELTEVTPVKHLRFSGNTASYAATKLFAEALVVDNCKSWRIYRPFNLVGYGQRPYDGSVVNNLIDARRFGTTMRVDRFSVRTFCSVNYCVARVLNDVQNGTSMNEIANVGSFRKENTVSIDYIADAIRNRFNSLNDNIQPYHNDSHVRVRTFGSIHRRPHELIPYDIKIGDIIRYLSFALQNEEYLVTSHPRTDEGVKSIIIP